MRDKYKRLEEEKHKGGLDEQLLSALEERLVRRGQSIRNVNKNAALKAIKEEINIKIILPRLGRHA